MTRYDEGLPEPGSLLNPWAKRSFLPSFHFFSFVLGLAMRVDFVRREGRREEDEHSARSLSLSLVTLTGGYFPHLVALSRCECIDSERARSDLQRERRLARSEPLGCN
jgi:hypothetical protein